MAVLDIAEPAALSAERSPQLSWPRRFWRGNEKDPVWVRPCLLGLIAITTVLYFWNLSVSGYANSFYSAAAQAGSESWKAFFFGSSDASNFITVDKTPASLWPMALSVRIFGLNSWSILAPQAIEGIAAVGILYLTVRRWFSPAAGLIGGLVLAVTPVAVLMFRFNNPDALLVLLLVAAAYATTRAIEKANMYWLCIAGLLIGTGFMTKMLQAFLVVPAFALAYLIAAPNPIRSRILHLLAAGAAMIVASSWWVAIVELWPESYRPYIGGSQTNSVIDLVLGYNGLGRITGNEVGSVGGGGGGPGGQGGQWGETGIFRMFSDSYGGQISWLLPAALILLVAIVVLSMRAGRTSWLRTAAIIWGGWLLVTGIVFSYMEGIIHEYYTIALAPAIAALVGIGLTELWRRRDSIAARSTLAAVVVVTGMWAAVLLSRTPTFVPWLKFLLVIGCYAVAAAILTLNRRTLWIAAVGAVVVGLAAPTAYAANTMSTAHTGGIVTAGPTAVGARGPGGGPGGGPGMRVPQGGPPPGAQGGGQGGPGAAGGLLNSSTPNAELISALQANAEDYTWVAATVGANSAAGYQLGSGEAVMALGGFNGSDPAPSLAQFQQYVADGQIHYFIPGGGMGGPGGPGGPGGQQGGSSVSSEITSWVEANYDSVTIGGVTMYDLTS